MLKHLFQLIIIPVLWIIAIQVLLCLPGSSIPSGGMFDIPHLDKFVHCFLFGGVTWVWCYYLSFKNYPLRKMATLFFLVYTLAAADGIVLEFVQRDYIPHRSFDLGDIIADVISASVAYGFANIFLLRAESKSE